MNFYYAPTKHYACVSGFPFTISPKGWRCLNSRDGAKYLQINDYRLIHPWHSRLGGVRDTARKFVFVMVYANVETRRLQPYGNPLVSPRNPAAPTLRYEDI